MTLRASVTPPPLHLVRALLAAGLSEATALAMDATKAEEVLRLLERSLCRDGNLRVIGGRARPSW